MAPNIQIDPSDQITATVIANSGDGRPRRFQCARGTKLSEVATIVSLSTSDNVARVNGAGASWDQEVNQDDRITFAPLKAGGAS